MGDALWRFGPRFVRFHHSEHGFTLAELLISIAILGIISGVLAVAFVVSGKTTAQTSERFNESHDVQIAAAYFATDVQGAQAITTPPAADSCFAPGGLTSFVNFSATQAAAYPMTSWFYGTATAGGSAQIVRRSCTGNQENQLTTDAPVIYYPGPSAPVLTVSATTVTVEITEHNRLDGTNNFVYRLTGARRAQASVSGSAPAAHASLMALATAGTSTVSGDVHVNGAPVKNSDHPDTPSADPFAGVPQCPAAAGCPSASGPGGNLPAGATPPGPGVYHNVTISSAVTFPPGVYVITGLLDVQLGAAGLNLAGVTLYFACNSYPAPCPKGGVGGSFNFGQQPGTVTLSPITSGQYAPTLQPDGLSTRFPGISIFVDRNNVAPSVIDGGTPTPTLTSTVVGAVYAAGARVTVSGSGAFVGGIVSNTFDIAASGANTIAIGG